MIILKDSTTVPPTSSVSIFPVNVALAQTKAANNTTQWQAFKSNLDANLSSVIDVGYEGDELEWVANYALGYLCLKSSDPSTASKYADKALGLISFGLTALQKQLGNAFIFLGRGDGVTTTFALPDSTLVPASITTYLSLINTSAVVKGVHNGADFVSVYSSFIKVSKTSDGTPDYAKNVDWRQTGDTGLGYIDWSLGSANQPTSRNVTDFNTTVGSPTLTSATANFTSADVGRAVTDNFVGYFTFSGNTTITSVTNSTTVTISPVANASGTNFSGTVADIYYVTYYTDIYTTGTGGWTYNSGTNSVVLTTAPSSSYVVMSSYVYGTWTGGVSTLGYQQTTDDIAGFNSIYVDDTYTSRYLGKFLSIGLDWLDGYEGFSSSLRSQIIAMIKRWATFLAAGPPFDGVNAGYLYPVLESNYGDGSYASLCATAVALTGRDSSAAAYQSMAKTLRSVSALTAFAAPTSSNVNSLYGGMWLEGIGGYVSQAAYNILEGGMILGQANLVNTANESAWAQQLMNCIAQAQITQTAITALPGYPWYFWGPVYDVGDGSNYPFLFPSERLFAVISYSCLGTAESTYANYACAQNINLTGTLGPSVTSYVADWHDLLFYDPSAASSSWVGSLPTQYFAQGAGLVMARNDWTFSGSYATIQAANNGDANQLGGPDHQIFAQGHVTLWRGNDNLLVTGSSAIHNQTTTAPGGSAPTSGGNKSSFCNLVITDDNGDGTQTYRWCQPAYWYGYGGSFPAVVVLTTDLQTAYVEATVNTLSAYTGPSSPSTGGVLSEMVRSWLYVRPDLLFVYDRVTSRVPGAGGEYPKEQLWNVESTSGLPTLVGNTLTHARGGSKLFGSFYSSVACTLSVLQTITGEDGYGTPHDVTQIVWQNSSPTTRVTYLACFQTASSAGSAYASASVTSGTAMEGALVGQILALFGATKTGNGPTGYLPATPFSYTYTAPGGTLTHYISDLAASHAYTLSGAASGTVTTSAAGVLTFKTSGTGSQTVTVT